MITSTNIFWALTLHTNSFNIYKDLMQSHFINIVMLKWRRWGLSKTEWIVHSYTISKWQQPQVLCFWLLNYEFDHYSTFLMVKKKL
jgi:hypothetical protein